MAYSPKPDLIFDPTLNIVGLKNKQNKLEIYADKIPEFNKTYWANWFGQKEVKVHPLTSNEFMTTTGHKIVINYNGNTHTVTLNLFQHDGIIGTVLVFCDKSLCYIKSENNNRFDRSS
jgi:hypothetical protein